MGDPPLFFPSPFPLLPFQGIPPDFYQNSSKLFLQKFDFHNSPEKSIPCLCLSFSSHDNKKYNMFFKKFNTRFIYSQHESPLLMIFLYFIIAVAATLYTANLCFQLSRCQTITAVDNNSKT